MHLKLIIQIQITSHLNYSLSLIYVTHFSFEFVLKNNQLSIIKRDKTLLHSNYSQSFYDTP